MLKPCCNTAKESKHSPLQTPKDCSIRIPCSKLQLGPKFKLIYLLWGEYCNTAGILVSNSLSRYLLGLNLPRCFWNADASTLEPYRSFYMSETYKRTRHLRGLTDKVHSHCAAGVHDNEQEGKQVIPPHATPPNCPEAYGEPQKKNSHSYSIKCPYFSKELSNPTSSADICHLHHSLNTYRRYTFQSRV